MDSRHRSLLVGVPLVTVPLYAPLFDVTGSLLSEDPLLERICEAVAVVLGLRLLVRVWSA
ncbi:hypothetical protein [Halogranum rubrum]|uniref:Uncharacterized protein n=1 Tax=Halogranum salarium B-1 TaxID=1210908 RepID=J3EZ27_9EURY|nr:hypothetical protein [Halogranum salarium]EJN60732.1 hypothetical protein HSB1_13350 [Halogranum salarium B-1]